MFIQTYSFTCKILFFPRHFCSFFVFQDMKSVMEEEFPDLGNLGDTIAKATQDAVC